MTNGNRRSNAAAEASLGDDALKAAEALLGIDLPNDAVSRGYYAAFHYARAVLLTFGLEPKTHRGVVALLTQQQHGLAEGLVSEIARLQTFRGLADYDARARLPAERAQAEVAAARRFVEAARAVLRDGGWLT